MAGKAALLVAGLGLVLGVASSLVPDGRPDAPAAMPAVGSWTEIVRPIQLYALVGTEFAKLPMAYTAERHIADGARRDLLSFGAPGGETPFLQLSFRRSAGPEQVKPLAADLAGIDPLARVSIARLTEPTTLDTRFGRFEAADLRLVSDRQSTPCIGFRSKPGSSDTLSIAGVACGTNTRPIGRDLLACVIDRIDLVSAGSDAALKTVFVDAERRRGPGCAPAPTVAAGISRVTWLDANAAPPPLKGLSSDARRR